MRLKYKVNRVPGGYRASVIIPVADKRGRLRMLRVSGVARFAEVRDAAKRKMIKMRKQARASGYDEVGFGFFKKIGRFVKKAAKSKALRRTFRKVKNTLKNPALQATLMAVNPAIGTGLMTTTAALDKADKLFKAARSGKPGSKNRVMARAAIKLATAQKYPPPQAMPFAMNPAMAAQMATMMRLMMGGGMPLRRA